LPGILYLHGGAMVMLKGSGPIYACIHDELAVKGLVVIGVEFRNGGGVLGPHPFPAGLGDCAAALDWVHAHRATLGISTLTVAGESGGGNLALATALRAKREGRLAAIDGADVLMIVTSAHLASLKATNDLLSVLAKLSVPKESTLLVLNQTTAQGLHPDQATRFFGRKPDVIIPFTPSFDDAADEGKPLVASAPGAAGSISVRDLAAQITVRAPVKH
jgi:acetyl esterase/lipase